MASKINISIPQPCHENWQDMTAMDKGRFCNSCQKEVFDFTSSSDREIINAFDKNKNLCGRFINSQLNRDLIKPKEKSTFWIAAITSLLSLIGVNEVTAQETPKTEQTDKKVLSNTDENKNKKKSKDIEVSGHVIDATGPLPEVIIKVNHRKKFSTDKDGYFKIKVRKNDVLEFFFPGYVTKRVKIENTIKLDIKLEEDSVKLGECLISIER